MFLQEVIQKIISSTFTWFTYFVNFPVCSVPVWLVLQFVVIIAKIFGAIQLLREKNDNDDDEENDINEMFVSTREALMTILPQASDEDIGKYDEQLSKVDNLDPVLIISANQNWINQYTYAAYQAVMNEFATNNLQNNRRRRRRDENSCCVFHFSSMNELYTVRRNVRTLHPNAFFDPIAQPHQEPIGTAWILINVAVRRSDFAEDDRFFVLK